MTNLFDAKATVERPRLGTLLIFISTILLLALIADPTDTGLGLPLTFQFVPAIVALAGGFMFVFAGFKFTGRIIWQDWGFLILIIMILFGGGATTFASGQPADSFFRLSLSSLSYVPYRILASQPGQLDWFMQHLRVPVILVALAMSFQLFYWQLVGPFIARRSGLDHIFHEEVFLLAVATIIVVLSMQHRPFTRLVLVAILMLGQLFTLKNTGFLTALLTLGYLFILPTPSVSLRQSKNVTTRQITAFCLILTICTLLPFAGYVVDQLPDGSATVRLYTYNLRWQQFLDNPVFGSMFQGSPIINVPGTNLIIPSHSDILDLLAYGGVVGAISFIPGVGSFLIGFGRLRKLNRERFVALVAHCLVFSITIVMIFNPVWLQPKMGGFLWMGLALLSSVYSRRRQPLQTEFEGPCELNSALSTSPSKITR